MSNEHEFQRHREIGHRLAELGTRFHNAKLGSVNRQWIEEVRWELALLEYLVTPVEAWTARPNGGRDVACSVEGCLVSWRNEDACLLLVNDRWYCRAHHPPKPDGGVHPPGYSEPESNRQAEAKARSEAWTKLTPQERSLINSRIVR